MLVMVAGEEVWWSVLQSASVSRSSNGPAISGP